MLGCCASSQNNHDVRLPHAIRGVAQGFAFLGAWAGGWVAGDVALPKEGRLPVWLSWGVGPTTRTSTLVADSASTNSGGTKCNGSYPPS